MRSVPLALVLSALSVAACSSGSSTSATPSSAAPASTLSAGVATGQPSPSGGSAPRLTGDGIDLPTGVVTFGTPVETAASSLRTALGAPTKDTGVRSSFSDYGTCPGTKLRALEYGGGALVVLFGDVKGKDLTMYAWELSDKGSPAAVPKASALVGDQATYDFGVGTTVASLRSGLGSDHLTLTPADDPVAASFDVKDQSSGFTGQLTGTSDSDKVTFIVGGQACGE